MENILCPGNTIPEGFVKLKDIGFETNLETPELLGFVGLNNGNGRGSMDAMITRSALPDELNN